MLKATSKFRHCKYYNVQYGKWHI